MQQDKTIKIACHTSFTLPYHKLNILQGDLKDLSKRNYERLRAQIIDTGYAFAQHVWKSPEGLWYLVDGTQRFRVIKNMVENEGWICPDLPLVEVFAKNEAEAKLRVLQGAAQFGVMNNESLYEFMSNADMPLTMIDQFRLGDINVVDFKASFIEPNKEDMEPKKIEVQCPNCGTNVQV